MEHRTLTFTNKYGGGYVQISDEEKLIFKIHCDCPDFLNRRLSPVGLCSNIKIKETPCKHLKDIIVALEKQGYKMKLPKPMEGPNKCTTELRKALIERSEGLCEMNCGRLGTNVHRKLRGSQGGKYILSNCILLCNECHKMLHSNEFGKVRSK